MTDDVKKEISKLKSLKQYAETSDESLKKQAEKNVVLRELIDSGNYVSPEEKKEAKKIFENYLNKLDFENYSDLSTLSILTYNQILLNRVQVTINECTTKEGKTYISDKMVKTLNDLTNQILLLKKQLGIDRDAKEDEFTVLQQLKKRFHEHIQLNKHEFTLAVPFKCVSCNKEDVKLVLLRKRVKDFDVMNHPFFSGRFYYNAEIISDVEKGLITKEQASRYLKTSAEYITWCIKNKGKIVADTDDK